VLRPFGLGFGDPAGHGDGVGASIQGGPVLDELAIAFGDLRFQVVLPGWRFGPVGGRGGQFIDRRGQVAGLELAGQPGVQRFEQDVLPQRHVPRVLQAVGQGVFAGEVAAVVGRGVGPVPLHPPVTDAAEQQPTQRVGVLGAVRPVRALHTSAGGQEFLSPGERVVVDDRRVGDLLGVDPLVLLVPPHLGRVPEGDVVHVEQDFVFALAVPDLAAGVARVGQDGADGVLAPGDPAAVPVALGVVRGRAQDAIGGQPFGDGVDAEPGQELGEDAHDYCCGGLVQAQGMESLAVSGLGWVRMWTGVDQQIAIRWPTTEIAAFDLGLGGHGGPDADLDPVALALGYPTEHTHDQVVRLVAGVDRAADLGHPQRDLVVLEQRVGVAELVTVESPLRLSHHDRVEAPVGVGQRGEQPAGLGPTLGRDRAGLVDVEELHDDLSTVRLD